MKIDASGVYMFHVQSIDGYVVVTGYSDGSDWMFEGAGRMGTFGPYRERLWMFAEGGIIRLFDLAQRRLLREIDCSSVDLNKSEARGGTDAGRLYIVQKLVNTEGKTEEQELVVVDMERGNVIARQSGLPDNHHDGIEVMEDGALLLGGITHRDGRGVSLLTRIDPTDFSMTESFVSRPRIPDGYKSFYWVGHSPRGKWWLRPDHTHFPMVEHSPSPGAPPRKYYGLTLQIWSAFPLRFAGRVVVAWLKAEDLPDKTHLFSPSEARRAPAPAVQAAPATGQAAQRPGLRGLFGRRGLEPSGNASPSQAASIDPHRAAMLASVPARDRIWQAVSTAFTRPEADPDGPFPGREEFGAAVHDDELWKAIIENLGELTSHPFKHPRWQDDGEAAWLDRLGFLICVGMDGTASPQIWSERYGLLTTMMRPFADAPQLLSILADRQLIAGSLPSPGVKGHFEPIEGGAFTIDGSPRDQAFEPVMIPVADDGWRAGPQALPAGAIDESAYRARIRPLKEAKSRIRIPLSSLGESDQERAIRRLSATIDHDFWKRADDHTIAVTFELDGREIPEKEFFESIGAGDRGWAVPTLHELIERFVDCVPNHVATLYQPNDDGLFGTAVLRLGELDHDSLSLIRRYGERMDGGHEYYFPGTAVPAIIQAHGWTEAMIDFGLWVLIFNFYNTFDTPTTVWRDLGLASALERKDPEAVAQQLVAGFAAEFEAKRLNWDAIGSLKRDLGEYPTQWEARFFDALERLMPGSTAH